MKLAFCWAHRRRKLIKATPKSGSPIVDEALVRIAALYKIEDSIRCCDPEHRRAVRQDLPLPLVDEFFTWLAAQAKRISRKSDLGKALAYMLTRQNGFRLCPASAMAVCRLSNPASSNASRSGRSRSVSMPKAERKCFVVT